MYFTETARKNYPPTTHKKKILNVTDIMSTSEDLINKKVDLS